MMLQAVSSRMPCSCQENDTNNSVFKLESGRVYVDNVLLAV
jgi:hypothetical protein